MSAIAVVTGTITKDPEQKTSKNNNIYLNFDVKSEFMGYNGEPRSNYYRITAFGDDAKQNIQKGDMVCVIGKLECSYKKTEDDKVYLNLNISASSVELLAGAEDEYGGHIPEDDAAPF